MGKTVTDIHTTQERAAQRIRTESRSRLTMWRFFAASVMLRHAAELVAAQGGAAGWWLTALCMLPALLVYSLLALALRLVRCGSIPALAECLFGRHGRRVVMLITALALLIEGGASLAALTTVFVDGVGTAVSGAVFAAAAAAVLCLCTERDGLLYGIGLLRWVLGAFAALILVNALGQARFDHLCPPGGDGPASWWETFRMWWSLGWPVILLLYEEPVEDAGRGWTIPPVIAAGAALVLCLALPHELLTLPRTLAERLLLPGLCLEPGNRVLLMCLWTAGMGLSAVISAVRATDCLTHPGSNAAKWLPCLLIALYAAVHLAGMNALETWLDALDGWLLAPFSLLTAAFLPMAWFRRKNA